MLTILTLTLTAAACIVLAGLAIKKSHPPESVLWAVFFVIIAYCSLTTALFFSAQNPRPFFFAFTLGKFLALLQGPILFTLVRLHRNNTNRYSPNNLTIDMIYHLAVMTSIALAFFTAFALTQSTNLLLSRPELIKAALGNVYYGQFHPLAIILSMVYLSASIWLLRSSKPDNAKTLNVCTQYTHLFLRTAVLLTALAWSLPALNVLLWWLATSNVVGELNHPYYQFILGNLRTAVIAASVVILTIIQFKAHTRLVLHPKGRALSQDHHNTDNTSLYKYDLNNESSHTETPINPYYIQKITTAFESDKIYLTPNLSIGSLSEHTGINPTDLSESLKVHFKATFFDQVNRYRIMKSKELLQSKHKQLSIEEVMRLSGFNSRTAFNRAFKLHTGMNPRSFRNQQLIASD